jgi:hypothetical protein
VVLDFLLVLVHLSILELPLDLVHHVLLSNLENLHNLEYLQHLVFHKGLAVLLVLVVLQFL